MQNGLWKVNHTVTVVIPLPNGGTKNTLDTLTLTVLSSHDSLHILTIFSKLDNSFVNLPPAMLQGIRKELQSHVDPV